MSPMNVVRVAKVIALLAFVLPWVAVSCANVDVATASGVELIQGKMTANPDAEKQMSRQMGSMLGAPPGSMEAQGGFGGVRSDEDVSKMMPKMDPNYFAIAAAAVIAIGLLLSLVGKGKAAARNVLITSLLGAALAFGAVWWWKDQIKKAPSPGEAANSTIDSPFGGGGNSFGGGMGMMGQGGNDQFLQERFGYWICLISLLVAAGAGAYGMAPPPGAAKPGDAPPAA